MLLIGSMLLVLSIELLNSAVEAVIERYGPEFHELAGRAKDMGSAAVFVLMMNVLLTLGRDPAAPDCCECAFDATRP